MALKARLDRSGIMSASTSASAVGSIMFILLTENVSAAITAAVGVSVTVGVCQQEGTVPGGAYDSAGRSFP